MALRSRGEKYANDVTAAAKEDLQEGAVIVRDATLSNGWLYPLYGMAYLLKTPKVWSQVGQSLFRMLILNVVVSIPVFAFAYVPQAFFLSLFSGPFAFFSAITLCISEAYGISLFIGKMLYLDNALDELFDNVLLVKGYEELASKGHVIKGRGMAKSLGRSLIRPMNRFSPRGMARYIITLPLNFIPVIGTAVWLISNGYFSGPDYMWRYHNLKGMTNKQKNALISRKRGTYTAFGTVALALSLVPFVGLVSRFSTITGAALLAVQIENEGVLEQLGGTQNGPPASSTRSATRKSLGAAEQKDL